MLPASLRACVLVATVFLTACGADTRPLWYTPTDVFSAPIPDAEGNIRALRTYGPVQSTRLTPDGTILDSTGSAPADPIYTTVYSDHDASLNAYAYGLTATGYLETTPARLEFRQWGPDNTLLRQTSIPLEAPEGLGISRVRYTRTGNGGQVVAIELHNPYPDDYTYSTLLVSLHADGTASASRFLPGIATVIVASEQRALLQQEQTLSVLDANSLTTLASLGGQALDAGNATSQFRAVIDPAGQFKVIVARAEHDPATYRLINEQTFLLTLSADGAPLSRHPWPGTIRGFLDYMDSGWLRQFPLPRLVALPDGGLVSVEHCQDGEVGCPSSGRYLLATTADGVERWRQPINLPDTLPIAYSPDKGLSFIRLPKTTDVFYSLGTLKYQAGRLWLMTMTFSRGYLPESAQTLTQIWSVDTATGSRQKRLSTFRQTLDFTVTDTDAFYVSHRGFADGVTRQGIARYR